MATMGHFDPFKVHEERERKTHTEIETVIGRAVGMSTKFKLLHFLMKPFYFISDAF